MRWAASQKSRDVNLAGSVSALPVARASQSSRLWPREQSWPLGGFRSDVGWKLLIIASSGFSGPAVSTLESILLPKIYLGTWMLYITHGVSNSCYIENIFCQCLRSNDHCFKSASSPVHADEAPVLSGIACLIG